jgi:ABC-2 type transport system ATP-binding protein
VLAGAGFGATALGYSDSSVLDVRWAASVGVSEPCQVGDRPAADGGHMTSSAVAVSGLRKAFGDKTVLDGIDFDVPAGTVFSLLGPNGAGKTTTVNVLTTLTKADAGTVRIAGHDIATDTKAVRKLVGVTGQFAAVDELLTGQENLQLMADLKHLRSGEGKRVVAALLDRFGLADSAQKLVSTYSGGMRRKLDLAMTLVGNPQIIFLDEPTTGLDPRSRRTMYEIVRELVGQGVTIFLTTQYLEEADQLADRVAVLDQGRLVAQGTPEDLKRQVPGSHVRLRFTDARDLDAAARVLAGSSRDVEDLTLRVPSDGRSKSLRLLLDRLDEYSINAEEFSVHTPDLDDVFLALTGRPSTEVVAQ